MWWNLNYILNLHSFFIYMFLSKPKLNQNLKWGAKCCPLNMCRRTCPKHTRCGSSWRWRREHQRLLTRERPEALWLSCRSKPSSPQTGRDSRSTLCPHCAPAAAQQSHPQMSPGDTKRRWCWCYRDKPSSHVESSFNLKKNKWYPLEGSAISLLVFMCMWQMHK